MVSRSEPSPTTVRVPVFRCHSEAVNIETEQKITPHEVRQLLTTAPGVVLLLQVSDWLAMAETFKITSPGVAKLRP